MLSSVELSSNILTLSQLRKYIRLPVKLVAEPTERLENAIYEKLENFERSRSLKRRRWKSKRGSDSKMNQRF